MERLQNPVSADELLVHFDWVRRLARNLVRDPELAEDVAQETWLSALEKPARERSNLRGWLARIVENTARQHGRSESARARREHRAARAEALPSTGELVELASLQRALVGHVLDLEEPYRSTILLHYFRELAVAKIAERERVSIDAVRSRITRGLEKLRAKLDGSSGGRERWMGAFAALSAPKSAAPLLPIASAALLVLVAGGAFWLPASRGSDRLRPELAISADVDDGRGDASLEGPAAAAEQRVAVASAQPGDAATVPAAFVLRFVDATTRAPIPSLAFVVVGEKPRPRTVTSGESDADGRAVLRDLPSEVLVVETSRQPPHAPAVRAFEPKPGAELEVEVGAGGRVRGRVVDDLGAPRSDVVLFQGSGPRPPSTVWINPLDQRTILARTDTDGRFAIEHLHSQPRGLWITADGDHAERWERVSFGFGAERWLAVGGERHDVHVEEGREIDVGDLVLPRDRKITGRIRYRDGAPAAGARISFARKEGSRSESAADRSPQTPSDPGPDEVRPGEALAGAEGRFELVLPASGLSNGSLATVTLANGYQQTARTNLPRAGETADIGDVVLLHRAPLELVVRRAAGASEAALERVTVRAIPREGSSERELRDLIHDPLDGVLRLSVYPDASELRAIEVESHGWETERIEVPGGTVEGTRFEVTLVPKPALRIILGWKPGAGPPPARKIALDVSACVLSPGERLAAGADARSCCGLGARTVVRSDNTKTWTLIVAKRRPYWIRVQGQDDTLPEQVFGPFEPSDEVHALELDPSELKPQKQPPAAEAHEVPPKTTPSEPWLRDGIVRARLVDTEGGHVSGGSLLFKPVGGDDRELRPGQTTPSSDGTLVSVIRAGRWDLRVQGANCRARDLGKIEVVVSETIDVGTIVLEALPVFRARIVDAEGRPAADIDVSAAGIRRRTDAQGQVALPGPLPASFVLRVEEGTSRDPAALRRQQHVQVEDWAPGATRDLVLKPWIELTVELEGLAPDLAEASVGMILEPLDRSSPLSQTSRVEMTPLRSTDAPAVRRFRVVVGPGRYRVAVRSLLAYADPIEVELGDSPAQRTVTMQVR